MVWLRAAWVGALWLGARVVGAQQAGAPPLAESIGFMGPVGQVQQSPLRQALVEVPARALVSQPWLRVERSTANLWNAETPLEFHDGTTALHTTDAELESLAIDVGVPINRWLSLGARVGVQRLWGGGPVDGLIEVFHNDFEFFTFDRGLVPAAKTELRVQSGRSKNSLHWVGPRALIPNPLLSAFVTLLQNRTTVVALRGDLQLPYGDIAKALNLRSPETAGGVFVWSRFLNVAAFFVSGQVLWHGNTRVGGLTTQPQLLGTAAAEFRVLPRVTLVLEDRLQSPLFVSNVRLMSWRSLTGRATSVNAYFTPVNLITGGVRFYLDGAAALTFYAGEDFMFCVACFKERYSRETNAPDVSVSVTLEQAIPGSWQ